MDSNDMKPSTTEETHETLTCDLCDRDFKTKARHKIHMRVHEEEAAKYSIFKCDLCDREFNSKMGSGVHKSRANTIKT